MSDQGKTEKCANRKSHAITPPEGSGRREIATPVVLVVYRIFFGKPDVSLVILCEEH